MHSAIKTSLTLLSAGFLALSLTACNPTKQNIGAVSGGVLGGVLGSQVGGGRGQLLATGVGAMLGMMAGSAIGQSMDDVDMMKANRAIESNRNGQSSSWTNPDSNAQYTVTPTRTYYQNNNLPCREYSTNVVINGQNESMTGTACRQENGTWKANS